MNSLEHDLEHPKKRRRREILRRPHAARLVFDDSIKGNAAIVSESLWTQLSCEADGATTGMRVYFFYNNTC